VALFSASALHVVQACAASVALPQVQNTGERAERGNAIHAFCEAVTNGVDRAEALMQVPAEWRETCRHLDVRDGTAEVAYAVRVGDGKARLLGRSIGRNYQIGMGEVAGTADLVRVEVDRVVVADYKTGRVEVEPAERNAQLHFLAYAASQVESVSRARVEIVYIHEDGSSRTDAADLDAFDLAEVSRRLRQTWEAVAQARDAVKAGRQPPLREGPHCTYCPARRGCPAKVALIRQLAEPADLRERFLAELTPETARLAYERLGRARALMGDLTAALYAYAAENPIALDDGRVFGPTETTREELDANVVFDVLEREHGTAVARAAVELSATKTGVERALRAVAKPGELAKLRRAVLAGVEAAGGIKTTTKVSVKEHRST
jgi:CRISPR/Cas system-associated exonuclease Cas4 (RecB family)